LSPEQEIHLFRKMNYLKALAGRLRDRIELVGARPGQLDQVEELLTEALAVRNRIIEANLRLVISIAGKHLRPGEDLSERISDGNVALIRAVEAFDFARGNRFSTYATWAVLNAVRSRRCEPNRRGRHVTGREELLKFTADRRGHAHDREQAESQRQHEVERWLGRLDDRERTIIASRYGIGGTHEKTLKQIGQDLGICKERVRQIEARAVDKLRAPALIQELDLLPA
jgi:RNA polymerase primary sigma factor